MNNPAENLVNIDKCDAVFDGNRFYMILAAAIRAREIASANVIACKANHSLKIAKLPVNTALREIADGKIGTEYLQKIR